MSAPATELTELHDLVGGLRRCVAALKARYGDSPAMRRIVIDADRILSDIDFSIPTFPNWIWIAQPCSSKAKRSAFPTPTTTANSGAMSMTRVSEVTAGTDARREPSPPGIRGFSLCTLRPDSPFEEEH